VSGEVDVTRTYKHVGRGERSKIEALKEAGKSVRAIAKQLGRAASTISRELRRNGGKDGYSGEDAHAKAQARRTAASSVPRKLTGKAWGFVVEGLLRRWSPQQIAGRLAREGKLRTGWGRIYQRIRAERAAGGALFRCLRHGGKPYRRRPAPGEAGRGCIPGRVDISERPAEVERKERVGDWELDTVIGKGHQGVPVTIVDRKSKFPVMKRVGSKRADEVGDAVLALPAPYRAVVRTITADNGKEFAGHRRIAAGLGADFYFAKPYSSWQRGLNEHTNGLVRQFLPKRVNLLHVLQKKVAEVCGRINRRPRKSLGYRTPEEVFTEALAAAGGPAPA